MAENNELADQLFGQKSMGAVEAAGLGLAIGVGALFEGLGKVAEGAVDVVYGESMQHFVEHGAHELAASLFGNGHAFVMYPHASKENTQEMGQEGFPRLYEASAPEPSQEMEHQRGGRGM